MCLLVPPLKFADILTWSRNQVIFVEIGVHVSPIHTPPWEFTDIQVVTKQRGLVGNLPSSKHVPVHVSRMHCLTQTPKCCCRACLGLLKQSRLPRNYTVDRFLLPIAPHLWGNGFVSCVGSRSPSTRIFLMTCLFKRPRGSFSLRLPYLNGGRFQSRTSQFDTWQHCTGGEAGYCAAAKVPKENHPDSKRASEPPEFQDCE